MSRLNNWLQQEHKPLWFQALVFMAFLLALVIGIFGTFAVVIGSVVLLGKVHVALGITLTVVYFYIFIYLILRFDGGR